MVHPMTAQDHEELRENTQLRVAFVQAPDEANAAAGPVFTASAVGRRRSSCAACSWTVLASAATWQLPV